MLVTWENPKEQRSKGGGCQLQSYNRHTYATLGGPMSQPANLHGSEAPATGGGQLGSMGQSPKIARVAWV